jgi:hypothetical protein
VGTCWSPCTALCTRNTTTQNRTARTCPMALASHNGMSTESKDRALVVQWLKENYYIKQGGSTSKCEVYNHYRESCLKDGAVFPISNTFFGKLLRRAFPSVKSNRKGPRGKAKQYYENLVRLSMHDDVVVPEALSSPLPPNRCLSFDFKINTTNRVPSSKRGRERGGGSASICSVQVAPTSLVAMTSHHSTAPSHIPTVAYSTPAQPTPRSGDRLHVFPYSGHHCRSSWRAKPFGPPGDHCGAQPFHMRPSSVSEIPSPLPYRSKYPEFPPFLLSPVPGECLPLLPEGRSPQDDHTSSANAQHNMNFTLPSRNHPHTFYDSPLPWSLIYSTNFSSPSPILLNAPPSCSEITSAPSSPATTMIDSVRAHYEAINHPPDSKQGNGNFSQEEDWMINEGGMGRPFDS